MDLAQAHILRLVDEFLQVLIFLDVYWVLWLWFCDQIFSKLRIYFVWLCVDAGFNFSDRNLPRFEALRQVGVDLADLLLNGRGPTPLLFNVSHLVLVRIRSRCGVVLLRESNRRSEHFVHKSLVVRAPGIEPIVLLGTINVKQLVLLGQVATLVVEQLDLAVQLLVQLLEKALLLARLLLLNPVLNDFALSWIQELVLCVHEGPGLRDRLLTNLRSVTAAFVLALADQRPELLGLVVVPIGLADSRKVLCQVVVDLFDLDDLLRGLDGLLVPQRRVHLQIVFGPVEAALDFGVAVDLVRGLQVDVHNFLVAFTLPAKGRKPARLGVYVLALRDDLVQLIVDMGAVRGLLGLLKVSFRAFLGTAKVVVLFGARDDANN